MASSMALMASTRCPPKSWAACSRCCFELRRDSRASRICGCFSGGAGATATAFAGAVAAGAPAAFGLAAAAGRARLNIRAEAERMLQNFLVIVAILQVDRAGEAR